MATERAHHPNCTYSSLLILGVENRVPNQYWSSVGLVHSSKEPTSLLWAKAIPASFYKHQPGSKSEVIPALYHSYLLFLIPLWPVAKFGYVLLWMIANPPTYPPTYLTHLKKKKNDHQSPPTHLTPFNQGCQNFTDGRTLNLIKVTLKLRPNQSWAVVDLH
jgi:hypothetical protein